MKTIIFRYSLKDSSIPFLKTCKVTKPTIEECYKTFQYLHPTAHLHYTQTPYEEITPLITMQ